VEAHVAKAGANTHGEAGRERAGLSPERVGAWGCSCGWGWCCSSAGVRHGLRGRCHSFTVATDAHGALVLFQFGAVMESAVAADGAAPAGAAAADDERFASAVGASGEFRGASGAVLGVDHLRFLVGRFFLLRARGGAGRGSCGRCFCERRRSSFCCWAAMRCSVRFALRLTWSA